MKLRKNRSTERAGVNAAQTFFESENWVFQPVDQGNDYGKDAYADMSDGSTVTGICSALQNKSGASFHRASGYAIPVEGHEQVWRESALPVMGIVHDPKTGQLYWCDISGFLRENPINVPASIPVDEKNVLTKHSLAGDFLQCIRRTAALSPFARSLLDLCSDSTDLQIPAILGCFRASWTDPRPLILVRRLIASFTGASFEAAIHMLALARPHGDIFLGPHNMLPDKMRSAISKTFRWTDSELTHMLSELAFEEWQRGGSGEDLYTLLDADADIWRKVRRVLEAAMGSANEDLAWTALYLLVYWARDDGAAAYQQIVSELPEVRSLPLAGELEALLHEGYDVPLFE